MPVNLDNADVAILKSLIQDGRKSFRSISRELKISTPTIKARYDRLVHMGLIKSISPEIDITKISTKDKKKFPDDLLNKRHFHGKIDNLSVKMQCEFCEGPIHEKPRVLKFADIERFFCCTSCRNDYKEKYGGRIRSLIEQYEETKKKK